MSRSSWWVAALGLAFAAFACTESIRRVDSGSGSGGGDTSETTTGAVIGGGGAGAGDVAGAGGAPNDPGVVCGSSICAAGDVCYVCDPADMQSPRLCAAAQSNPCGGLVLQMQCDDDADCPAGQRCTVSQGAVGTYVQCEPTNPCMDDCSCPDGADGGYALVCGRLADCPPCATACGDYVSYPGWTPLPLDVCTW